MKKCTKCTLEKTSSSFLRNSLTRDKLSSWCRQCTKEYLQEARKSPRGKAVRRAYDSSPKGKSVITAYNNSAKGKAAQRAARLKKYNMTETTWEEMLSRQGGVCAICKGPSAGKEFSVDHDHTIFPIKARALLCGPCNLMIGASKENVARLQAGADFIKTYILTKEQ